MQWIYLFAAILSEVIATLALKGSNGFARPLPTLLSILGYAAAFYFLSLTLRTIPVGVAYALWSGVGILLVSLTGLILYKQTLDMPAILGIALIAAGAVLLCVFSKVVVH